MDFVSLYCTLWISGLVWFALFSIHPMEIVRNLGFALISLGAGVAAVGIPSAGFMEADLGPLLILTLALGVGGLAFPMLAISNYFKKGEYCRRVRHKRGKDCTCTICGQFVGHERGDDCTCTVCGKSVPHEWIPREEGQCALECSNCGFTRATDEHSWVVYPVSVIKKCSICGLVRPLKTDVRIDNCANPCDKNAEGHHIVGCCCEYCDAIIIEGDHLWKRIGTSSHDGSGETLHLCPECDLKRHEYWNPHKEGIFYSHDRAAKKQANSPAAH